jgi:hypothetical protein
MALGDHRAVFPTAGRRRPEASPPPPCCPAAPTQSSRHLHTWWVRHAMEMLYVRTSSRVRPGEPSSPVPPRGPQPR